MVQRLKRSPLAARVPPKRPLSHWIWLEKGSYHGLFVHDGARAHDMLAPYLEHCERLLAVPGGLCLLFREPVRLDPSVLGAMLALRKTSGGGKVRTSSFGLRGRPSRASPNDFHAVKEALETAGFTPASAELTMEPSTTVQLAGKEAEQMLRLADALEDLDDVQNFYANFDISEEELESFAG